MSIELRHLRHIIAAAEQGSFRRAAQTLRLRQSTLSRRIRQIEERLGVVLFERNRGGARLTQAGKALVQSAGRLVEELNTAISTVTAIGRGDAGRLTVGFYTSLSTGNLRAALVNYFQLYPAVDVCAVERPRSQLFSELKSGSVDLGVITGNPNGFDGEIMPLWSERIVAAVPESHSLAAKPFVYWRELKAEPLLLTRRDPGSDIMDMLTARLAAPGDRPRVTSYDISGENVLSLVAAGLGVSLQCEASIGAAYSGVVYREVRDRSGPSRIEYTACWSKNNSNPALARFLELIHARHNSASPVPARGSG